MEEYNLFGRAYEIGAGRQNFNQIRALVRNQGLRAAESFREEYGRFGSFIEMTKGIANLAYRKIYEAADTCVQYLIDHDVYDVNGETLINASIQNAEVDGCLSELVDWIEEFQMANEKKEQYRQQRKANRGRVIGGGFGLSGAIKGILTAKAINAATGAAYSVYNMVEKEIEQSENRVKLAEKLGDQKMLNDFVAAVYNDVFALQKGMMRALSRGGDRSFTIVTDEDRQRAEILYDNLTNRSIPADKQKELMFQLVQLDPYNKKYYALILARFPEEGADVIRLARYFNVNLKEHYEEVIYKAYEAMTITDEESALKAKEYVLEQMQRYQIRECRALPCVEQDILRMQQKSRTYDGVVYDTLEACEKARQDDAALREACGDLSQKKRAQLLDVMRIINQSDAAQPVRQKYTALVMSQVERLDQQTLNGFIEGNSFSLKTDDQEFEAILDRLSQLEILPKVKAEGKDRLQKRYDEFKKKRLERMSDRELYEALDLDDSMAMFKQMDIILRRCDTAERPKYQRRYEILTNDVVMKTFVGYEKYVRISPKSFALLVGICLLFVFAIKIIRSVNDNFYGYGVRALQTVLALTMIAAIAGLALSVLAYLILNLLTFGQTVYPGSLAQIKYDVESGENKKATLILFAPAAVLALLLFIDCIVYAAR
ncbi:MAG: hypothetical protein ACI4XW_13925 [Candidatus Spyradocola sp.]